VSAIEGLLFDEAPVRARARKDRTTAAHWTAPASIERSVAEIHRRDLRYHLALACADAAGVAIALVAAWSIVGAKPAAVMLAALPLSILLAKLQGLYDRDAALVHKTTLDDAPKIVHSTSLTAFLLWLAAAQASRLEIFVFWLVAIAATLAGRALARELVRRAVGVERCVFIGDSAEYVRLSAKLRAPGEAGSERGSKALLVGCISPTTAIDDDARTAPDTLLGLLGEAGAQRVIIEPHALPSPETLDLVQAVSSLGMRVSLLPKVLDVVGTAVEFDELDGMTLLGVQSFGLTRSSRAIKRAFDLAVAGTLTLMVAPLMALIAVAIRLDSGGPVFYRQVRVGRGGTPFTMWKFRSMIADAEQHWHELRKLHGMDDGLFKLERDPRMTRVGRLLRQLSLDELPQLFNVLSGEMSLVGPRPLLADEDAQIQGWDRRRLDLVPGMTGRWQIAGSARIPLPEMVKIDYLYAAGWSLWSDLKILLRTVPFVLTRRGI
jgi:exopolysaccharide biosynthesis polyprenyl glycosylphosphotransferase